MLGAMNDDTSAERAAQRQHGLLTRSKLRQLGFSPRVERRRVATGRWQYFGGGVLFLSPAPMTYRQRCCWASMATGGVVSHHSAALLQGLPGIGESKHDRGRLERRPVSVVVTPERWNQRSGITVHRSKTVRVGSHIEGIPTTSAERTAVDLSSMEPTSCWHRVVDLGLANGKIELTALAREMDDAAYRGRPGLVELREVVAQRFKSPGTASELEFLFRELLEGTSFPPPTSQRKHSWGRVDFVWADVKVVIEMDSRSWHARFGDFEKDRRRDQLAQLEGWRTFRFTWDQIKHRPHEILEVLAAML